MGKCRNCNIEILDEAEFCPLCQTILEPTDELENMYPNVRIRMRRLKLFSRIYLFLAICVEAVLFGVNVLTESKIWWSAITGLVFLYFYMVLRYAILGKSGYRSKVFVLALLSVLCAVTIDFVIGYRGWSVDYVLPLGIIFIDISIFILMMVNRRGWQSYLIWVIFMLLCSLIPAGLYIAGLEHNICFAFLPLSLSLYLFLGSMIIGGRRARLELKRRFHF